MANIVIPKAYQDQITPYQKSVLDHAVAVYGFLVKGFLTTPSRLARNIRRHYDCKNNPQNAEVVRVLEEIQNILDQDMG
jgi:hypothetical protein